MKNRIDWMLLVKSLFVAIGIFLAFLVKSLIVKDDTFFETNALLTWIPIVIVETIVLYIVVTMRNKDLKEEN